MASRSPRRRTQHAPVQALGSAVAPSLGEDSGEFFLRSGIHMLCLPTQSLYGERRSAGATRAGDTIEHVRCSHSQAARARRAGTP